MKKGNKSNSLPLRQQAEELLKKKKANSALSYTEPEMLKLIHELEVHQIELELVNEELNLAKEYAESNANKYIELYDFAPSGYITLTKSGEIIKLNLNAAKLLGKERSMLIGSKFGFFVSTDTKPCFNNFIERVFFNPTEQKCELELLTNNSYPLYVILTGIAAENGEHCLVTMFDLTEQKLAEKELAESELRFRLLFDKAPLGYQSLDEDGCFIDLNQAWIDTLGYSREEVIGKWFGDFLTPKFVDAFRERFPIFIAHGKIHSEFEMVHKNGSVLFIAFDGRIARDLQGNFKQTHCILKDITQQKQAETELKIAHQKLEQLYIRQDDIKENERKTIAREIHDELGQLLTALKIDLSWAKDNVGDCHTVKNRIAGMIDLVDETIKSVQRISADIRPGLLDDLGLIPTIEWCSQEFEMRTGINCHFAPLDIRCTNEKKNLALYRIVQEGLTNVIRHAKAKNVTINLNRVNDKLVLEIIDDGVGLHKEQVDSIKSLGIIGIKERVKQYNGIFEITSDLDKGTKLHIEIPYK